MKRIGESVRWADLTIRVMFCRHCTSQRDNPDSQWNLPEDFSEAYGELQGELIIGGVYIRLFISNPGWVLRKPKEFMIELLERWSQIISVPNLNVSHMDIDLMMV